MERGGGGGWGMRFAEGWVKWSRDGLRGVVPEVWEAMASYCVPHCLTVSFILTRAYYVPKRRGPKMASILMTLMKKKIKTIGINHYIVCAYKYFHKNIILSINLKSCTWVCLFILKMNQFYSTAYQIGVQRNLDYTDWSK